VGVFCFGIKGRIFEVGSAGSSFLVFSVIQNLMVLCMMQG